ncbi:MAG: hypothetical protein WC957_06380 [Candidatus Neomarinimicrobiota bacterium]|jgi:hypothetical protein
MKRKVYRLSKDTNEITEIPEAQALKIIGYYYEEPQKTLLTEMVIDTPYQYISQSKIILKAHKLNRIKSNI